MAPKPEPLRGKEPSYLSTPPHYPLAKYKVSHLVPFWIKEGRQKVSVYLNYMSCEAFTHPAASIWREVLMDEKLIPFSVSFSNQMNKTVALMDLIFPDCSYLERHDPETMPLSLWSWLGIRQPVIKPLGEAIEFREVVMISSKKNGVWPIYGRLDPATGKIVDERGEEIKPEYGFNPLATFKPHPWHWNKDGTSKLKDDELILTTFKWNVHTQSRTPNLKWLTEILHSNPAWINTETAPKLGIKDGDLIRITSGVGYMVTKAKVTEGIHPKVVAVSNTQGTKFGRYALGRRNGEKPMWGGVDDPDLKNIWWTSEAVNPNDIIPVSADPIGGGQGWYDTVVKVTKAEPGDKLGDIKVDNSKHFEFFRETERYAYTGDKHREMHPEVKVEKLPEPQLKIGH